MILTAHEMFEAVASDSSGTIWVPTIVSIVALAVSVWTFLMARRRDRLDRQRQVFADAMDAVMTCREYPFIVYRRNPAEAAKDRQRISADLSELQGKLNGLRGRLRVEDSVVGERFSELLDATRRIAGPMITDAWNRQPPSADHTMHNPGWSFEDLEPYDEAYLEAVADHLDWTPAWIKCWRRNRKNKKS